MVVKKRKASAKKSRGLSMIRKFLLAHWRMLVIFAVYLVITLPHLGFVPYWDGGVYYQCVLDILRAPFKVADLHCFNHPALTHIGFVSFSQAVAPGSLAFLQLLTIMLGVWAGIAFSRLVSHFIDARDPWLAPVGVALFLFAPVSVAHLFHLNLDTLMLFTWIIGFDFFVRRRFVLAALFFTLTVFSKESGLAIVGETVVLVALLDLWDTRKRLGKNLKALAPSSLALLLPFGLFTVNRFIVYLTSDYPLFWSISGVTSSPADRLRLMTSVDFHDASFRGFVFDIFVLNFQWLLSVLVIAGFLHWLLSMRSSIPSPVPVRRLILLGLLMLFTAYFVTRVRNWNNTRYVLCAYPVLILCALAASRRLLRVIAVRASVLSIVVLLFFLSLYRTIDPLSVWMYGTIPFGEHGMLNRNSFILRDPIVYNLEFMQFGNLTRDIFRDLRVTGKTPILLGQHGVFGLPGIDASSNLTWMAPTITAVQYFENGEIPAHQLSHFSGVQTGYYIEYPHLRNDANLARARSLYHFMGIRMYENDGYAIRVHAFTIPRP